MHLKLKSSKCASLTLTKDGTDILDLEDDEKSITFHDLKRPQDEIGIELPLPLKLYNHLAVCMSHL